MKFSIVEFLEEKTVEVVPVSWIVGHKCYWPPGPGYKASLVKKAKAPGTGWKKYVVKVKATYNSYEAARANLNSAQYKSDLECDAVLEPRKISKPSRYLSDDEMPAPPTLPSAFPDPLNAAGSELVESAEAFDADMSSEQQDDEDYATATHTSSPKRAVGESEPGKASTSQDAPTRKKLLSSEEFQYQVLTKLTVLRMVQQQQGDLLTAFMTRYSQNERLRLQEKEPVMKGPFNSYDELKRFDAKLSGSTRERFVQELSKKGGVHATQMTRRLLRLLLSDSLAAQFSWFGKKGKHAFQELRMSSCIVSAVSTAHDSSEYAVEAAVRDWLRHAPARYRRCESGESHCSTRAQSPANSSTCSD